MTKEKQIIRICEKCNLDKRTTVHVMEEAVYFCRRCKKEAGTKVLLGYKPIEKERQPNPMEGLFLIAIILFVVGFLVGKFVF